MKYPVNMNVKPDVKAFFDPATNTISYVVKDPASKSCAVIDSVMDIDYAAGRITYDHADEIIDYIKSSDLKLEWIIETHVHADHLSAAPYIQKKLGGKIGIGDKILVVQDTFGKVFNEGTEFQRDGSQFDALFKEGDSFHIGQLRGDVLHTPGHTPACLTYVIEDAAFVGDTLFMPDFGTARTDFPGGSATRLYESIRRILSLPDDTRLFMCHDYKAPGREEFAWETSVAEQRARNIHINDGVSRDEFVRMREERDSQLGMPKLILPSLQVNLRAGDLPEPEDNNIRYLKIPLDAV